MPSDAAAISVLASTATHGRIEGVAERLGDGRFRFSSAVGAVTWRRDVHPTRPWQWTFEVEESVGVDLLAIGHTDGFIGLGFEQQATNRWPIDLEEHGRPYAYESLSQLFDDPKVSDLLSVPAPTYPQHGNTGNHGALTSVQSRGMFIAAGPRVRQLGWIADHGRMIDVAPTVLALLGAPLVEGKGTTGQPHPSARLVAQDGAELSAVIDDSAEPAEHVVVVVLDGCNTNLVADAIDAGEVPALADLLARGTGLRHGIVSSFPTVTLPNHVTAFTGVHPGRHGIINNEFLDHNKTAVDLLSFKQMIRASEWLSSDIETLHEAIHRWQPTAFSSAHYEYCDRGANWSTFGEHRARQGTPLLDEVAVEPQSSALGWQSEPEVATKFRFISRVDETCVVSAIARWAGLSETGHPLPTFQIVNLNATDETGHRVGPHHEVTRAALVDCDRRLARLTQAIANSGVAPRTTIIVMSDHGMEHCDRSLLEDHPHADLTELLASVGLREVGDVFLFPKLDA